MSAWSSTGVGAVTAGETYTTFRAKYPKPSGSKAGIVFCHGNNGVGTDVIVPAFSNLMRPLADAGYSVLSGDWGGSTTWANDTALARVSAGRTYLQSSMGAKAGKVVVVGASMGGAVALAWAAANPTLVSCVVGFLPAVNITDIVSNNRGGLAATINAAYSGGWSEATYGPTHNPVTRAAAGSYAGIPLLLFYGTSDDICLPAQTQALATSVGAGATLVAVSGGHTMTTYASMSSATVLDFISTNA